MGKNGKQRSKSQQETNRKLNQSKTTNQKLKKTEEGESSGELNRLEKRELSFENLFSRLIGEKNIHILIMGPDAAGKKMILDELKHGEIVTTTATISDSYVETVKYKNINFSVWDFQGQDMTHYSHRTHGLIFVVDCNDHDSFVKAKHELHLMMNKDELRDAVLLVFPNNQALPNAMSIIETAGTLELHSLQQSFHIQRDGDGLDKGLDWLSSYIAYKDFTEVRIDMDHMEYLWAPATFIKENDDGTLMMKLITEKNKFSKKSSLCTNNFIGEGTTDIIVSRCRPSPPNFGVRSYQLYEKVDVLIESGWCPGIITKICLGRKFFVSLGRDNQNEYFDYWQLRPCMDWKDRSWHTKSSEKQVVSGIEKKELSPVKLFSRLYGKEEIRILMMGPDATGKKMILDTLQHGENGMTTTTTAIVNCNVETVEHQNISFSMWDVWGEDKRHYLHHTHGLIFVVDCNTRDSIMKAKDELHLMMNKDELRDAVLLVFANNQALPNAMSISEIAGTLDLHTLQQGWHIQRDGEELYEGLDWLSSYIAYKDFTEVRIDMDHMEYLWAPATFIKENDDGTLMMNFITEKNKFSKKSSLCTNNFIGEGTTDVIVSRCRPSPPNFGVRSYQLYEKVDVLIESGWCPGIITKICLGRKFFVSLGRDNQNEYFDYWQLRPRMDWKDRSWQTDEEKGLDSEQSLYVLEDEVEELIKLLFCGFLFSREDERAWCTVDSISHNSSSDNLELMSELKSISQLSQLLYQPDVASKKVALECCFKHAKLWLANSDQLVNYSNCRVSYARLKNTLQNIMESPYFINPEKTILKYTLDFSRQKIIIFWDFENASIPKGQDPSKVFDNIVSALRKLNLNGNVEMVGIGNMKHIEKYKDILKKSGITFMHVPGGKKNAADAKIIVEMLVWAFQHEVHHSPGNILVITGDSDYLSVIEKLRKRGFNMLVAYNPDSKKKLSRSANSGWLWKDLVKGDISEELIQKLTRHVSH